MARSNGDTATGCTVIAVLVVLLLLVVVRPIAYRVSGTDQITVKVVKLEQVKKQDTGKYLVFTDGEVFEITDSLMFLRWDSSDLYGRMEAGKTYRVRVAGWRVQPLSWYRNIISAEEVPSK